MGNESIKSPYPDGYSLAITNHYVSNKRITKIGLVFQTNEGTKAYTLSVSELLKIVQDVFKDGVKLPS